MHLATSGTSPWASDGIGRDPNTDRQDRILGLIRNLQSLDYLIGGILDRLPIAGASGHDIPCTILEVWTIAKIRWHFVEGGTFYKIYPQILRTDVFRPSGLRKTM